MKLDADIIVIGGGMVGAAFALAAAQSGLRLIVVDALRKPLQPELTGDADVNNTDRRVSAVAEASSRWLHSLGVNFSDQACQYRHMRVWDGAGSAAIEFHSDDLHLPNLGQIVENRHIVWALYNACCEQENITWLGQTKLQQFSRDPVAQVSLSDGNCYRARLLVGADGALSAVRSQANIGVSEYDYRQHAIVATVACAEGHQNTAWQCFTPQGPLAFLPLPEQHLCSIVWSIDEQNTDAILGLNEQEFCQQLGITFEHRLGPITASSDRASFPLLQRHAQRYCLTNLALIGDAAHSIHPLAGQGVNLGFADAQVLAEELAKVAKFDSRDLGDLIVLRRYQRRRRAANQITMTAMQGLKSLFGSDDPGLLWLRNTGLRLVNQLPAVKNRLITEAMGLQHR